LSCRWNSHVVIVGIMVLPLRRSLISLLLATIREWMGGFLRDVCLGTGRKVRTRRSRRFYGNIDPEIAPFPTRRRRTDADAAIALGRGSVVSRPLGPRAAAVRALPCPVHDTTSTRSLPMFFPAPYASDAPWMHAVAKRLRRRPELRAPVLV